MARLIRRALVIAFAATLAASCSSNNNEEEQKEPSKQGASSSGPSTSYPQPAAPSPSTPVQDENCTTKKSAVTYTADIKPFIKSTCLASGCHGTTKPKSIGLTTYRDVKKSGSKVVAVVATKEHQDKQFKDAQVKMLKSWKSASYPERLCKQN